MSGDHLGPYWDKRNFDRTAEPDGRGTGSPEPADSRSVGSVGSVRFVVQEHAARRHHYDLRFEVDGVLASWAVPKGPSYDPAARRLAVQVEDHPLDYRTFEGTIPKGEYGGGAVIVWDQGSYRNDSVDHGKPIGVRQAIEKGHLTVWLEGEKLRGGWSLVRTGSSDGRNWLMIKRRDDAANPDRDVQADSPASVTSGRRLEEVAATGAAGPQWTAAVATWRPPMLAELTSTRGSGSLLPRGDWRLERKLDGLRCIAVRNGDDVALWSRGHQSYTERFGEVARALAALPADNFVVDGEVVAFDDRGRSSFSLLQRPGGASRPVFCAFDLLHLLGRSTLDLPVTDRAALLAQLIAPGDVLALADVVGGEPAEALAGACAKGWEGLIAKRTDSTYRSGRSPDWRKLKCTASQELVIGGWTDPRGSRHGFGALLVGYHDAGGGGGLRYAGKVGTGFDTATLETLYALLREREQTTSPFEEAVAEKAVHWVSPDMVAAVGFTEWTTEGRLRHPRFEGLRQDKPATEVVREGPGGPADG